METDVAFSFFLIYFFLFSEDFARPGTIIHIFFTLTKDSAGTKFVLGNRFFQALSGWALLWCVFNCCSFTHYEKRWAQRESRPRLAPFYMGSESNGEVCALLKVFESEEEEPTRFVHVIRARPFISQKQFLASKQQVEVGGGGRNSALLLSKG